VAAIVVGLLLGVAGPFGSYPAYPTATRYAFWLGLTAVGVAAAVAADAVLPAARLRAGPLRTGALALVSALPMTFVVAVDHVAPSARPLLHAAAAAGLFGCVAAVQLLIVYAATAPRRRPTAPRLPTVRRPTVRVHSRYRTKSGSGRLSLRLAEQAAAADRQRHHRS
jgi:hypothetical protein